jgi:hypothetical protein
MYGHVHDSLGVNVRFGIVHVAENTIMANIYQDILHLFLFPHIAGIEQEEGGEILFQGDGAAACSKRQMRSSLNIRFPNLWTGRGGLTLWSP